MSSRYSVSVKLKNGVTARLQFPKPPTPKMIEDQKAAVQEVYELLDKRFPDKKKGGQLDSRAALRLH